MMAYLLALMFGPRPRPRPPKYEAKTENVRDYALEHAEFLATDIERFLAYLNEICDEEEGTLVPDERYGDHTDRLRSAVYEFRKRYQRLQARQDGR